MLLFNKKVISKALPAASIIPTEHYQIIQDWVRMLEADRNSLQKTKETALHADFKSKIVEGLLGYTSKASAANYSVESELTIMRGSVDLALGHFSQDKSEIIAPFELKGASTKNLDAIMPGRDKSPVQQAWEYAIGAAGAKWVLLSNMVEIRLYGFGEGIDKYEVFELEKLGDPSEYARFMLLLSAQNLLGGKTRDLLEASRKAEKDITNQLYRDYKSLRETLIEAIGKQNLDIPPLEVISIAQKILDRILFTAFAEDTALLPNKILERAFEQSDPFNPRPVWDNFKGLFRAIDKGNSQLSITAYNGGLFAPNPKIDALELPDSVCEEFKKIGDYDFASEISVTVLGHIFENSIADVERLQAQARGEEVKEDKKSGTTGKRKQDGVVYTPDAIARFIVEQTLGTHINEIFSDILRAYAPKNADITNYDSINWKPQANELKVWESYQNALKNLRIVDPACGSGEFLVVAFDFMKAELNRVNDKIAELRGGTKGMFDPDSEILVNNLFGVDVNMESIQIAKLSLWIKTAKHGKALDSLDGNFKVGDSLIETSNYNYYATNFTWKTAFPQIFAKGGFDVVLGNPPYVRQERLGAIKSKLQDNFKVYHGVADLYSYFFERGLRILKPGGRLGYISSSTFFKTNSGAPLRDYLRQNATIESMIDFGDLQVFEGVTTYPAILTMRNQPPASDHDVRFWNMQALPQDSFQTSFIELCAHYPQAQLTSASWQFENSALKALRDKITSGKKTLKEVYGSPLYGIKTGRNEAFVIDRATRDKLLQQDPKSAEVLKPLIKGNELRRWVIESKNLSLIFFQKGWTNANFGKATEEIQWLKLQEKYPAVACYLQQFKTPCQKRTDKGDFWWELRSCDYYHLFLAPKISYIEVCSQGEFVFENTGLYQEATTFMIPNANEFLLALLNSKLSWFFWCATTSVFRGGYQRMKNQYVEPLPIPEATAEQQAELTELAQQCQQAAEKRFQLQQAVTRRIADLCTGKTREAMLEKHGEIKLSEKLKSWWELIDFPAFQAEIKKVFKAEIPLRERNDWEDWIKQDKNEIQRLDATIKSCEDAINARVYQLFDLSEKEIRLLEANI